MHITPLCIIKRSVIVSYTQRRKLTVVYSLLNHDCTTFTSSENILNENTVRTEGIQITLYFIKKITYKWYKRVRIKIKHLYLWFNTVINHGYSFW